MFKLVKFLLHLVHITSLCIAKPITASLGQFPTSFKPMSISHLLQQTVHLLLINGRSVYIVQSTIQFLSFYVQGFKHVLELRDAGTNLWKW